MKPRSVRYVHEVDTPHPAGNDLSRREINADLTAMGVNFHSSAGVTELALLRREERRKRGR